MDKYPGATLGQIYNAVRKLVEKDPAEYWWPKSK